MSTTYEKRIRFRSRPGATEDADSAMAGVGDDDDAYVVVPVDVSDVVEEDGRGRILVAESPELTQFKYANHYLESNSANSHFKRSNPLVCRVTS